MTNDDINSPFTDDAAASMVGADDPAHDDTDGPEQRVPLPAKASIAECTDELSMAAKAQMRPMHKAAAEVVLPPGRFKLTYEYNGAVIVERHRTVPHALASIRRLKMLGIVPATSTDPAPAPVARAA